MLQKRRKTYYATLTRDEVRSFMNAIENQSLYNAEGWRKKNQEAFEERVVMARTMKLTKMRPKA
jgi:hypothetical protein